MTVIMLNDMGILADSVRYYHDADAFTAANLYYVPHAGSYHCDESYGMQRDYLDICQMLVVDEGELSVTYRGETRTAGPGSLVLLDCREAHSYHAVTPIRMRWFHFEGSGSTAYTQLILNTHGFILPTGQNAEIDECIRRIMISVHQNQPNPHIVSLTINKLLVLLVIVLGEKKKSDLEIAIPGFRRLYDVQFRGQVTLHRAPVAARCAQHLLLYAQVQGIPVRYTASVFADRASERREAAAAHHLAEHRDHRG